MFKSEEARAHRPRRPVSPKEQDSTAVADSECAGATAPQVQGKRCTSDVGETKCV